MPHPECPKASPRLLPLVGLIVACLLVLAPPYIKSIFVPAVGLFHDDGIYVLTSRALAEGEGYRLVDLPSEPAQTKYPPLFPLVLAIVWKLAPAFPENTALLKSVPFVFGLLWLYLSYRLLRRIDLSRTMAFAIVGAVAAAPSTMYLFTTLLSETLFAALCMASLLFAETLDTAKGSLRSRVILAAAFAALATLARLAGVALVLAVLGWLLTRKQWKPALLFVLVVGILLAPWVLWVAGNPSAGYYGSANYASWNILSPSVTASIGDKLTVAFKNAIWIFTAPSLAWEAPMAVFPVLTLLTAALLVAGTFRTLPRNRPTFWFVVAYLGLVVCWAWPPHRFVITILPLVLWLMLQGLPVRFRSSRPFALVVVALVVTVPCVFLLYRNVNIAGERGTLPWTIAEVENWSEIRQVADWIRSNTDPKTIVVGNLDPAYFLLTDRKAMRGFEVDPFVLFYATEPHANALRLVWPTSHEAGFVLVESPDYFFAERPYLRALLQERKEKGHLVEQASFGDFRIYRPKDIPPETTPDLRLVP